MDIWEKIQNVMQEKGMTIDDLARDTGINRLELYSVCGNLHGLKASHFLRILEVLELDFSDFMTK